MIRIDMKMPENCANCPLIVPMRDGVIQTEYFCRIDWQHIEKGRIFGRPEWCPIKEDRTEND